MARLLTEDDYKAAAKQLKCDIAAIKAVAEVESNGHGFLSDGKVKILFEGHIFHRYTDGKFDAKHPTISYPRWTTEYYAKGATTDIRGHGELKRLREAMALDRKTALMSASYGKFQIMGFNFPLCGFKTVEDFYKAMQINEGEQLKAFCHYIINVSLDDQLRTHHWTEFAKRYNGPDYKKNKYDLKLALAYAKYVQSSDGISRYQATIKPNLSENH